MAKMMTRSVVLLILISLGGCASIPKSLPTIEKTEKAQKLLKNQSMAFGRFVSESPRYVFYLHATNLASKRKYIITNPPTGKLFSQHKADNRDGYFFVFLPPGDYQVRKMIFTDMNYVGDVKTDMRFTVARDSAVYLGTLSFEWERTKNYLIVQKGNIHYLVRDEYDDAVDRLWRRFPELKKQGLNVKSSVIEIEGGVPMYTEELNSDANTFDMLDMKDSAAEGYQPLSSESINNTK